MNLGNYLLQFAIYIMAMVGVAFCAFIVWRKTTTFQSGFSKNGMKIEDTLNLSPRKTLYIIRIQNERFLIASDADKTVLLSKLEENEVGFEKIQQEVLREDKKEEITKNIKFKEIEEIQEPKKEEKPKNVLMELMKNNGIGR